MKKGFLVYFDNCRLLEALPDSAYAAVWHTVTEYARRVAEEEGREGTAAERWLTAHLEKLPPEAAMAVRFMAENIRRDDAAYRERIAQRRERAEQYRSGARSADSQQRELAFYVSQLHRGSGEGTRDKGD